MLYAVNGVLGLGMSDKRGDQINSLSLHAATVEAGECSPTDDAGDGSGSLD